MQRFIFTATWGWAPHHCLAAYPGSPKLEVKELESEPEWQPPGGAITSHHSAQG